MEWRYTYQRIIDIHPAWTLDYARSLSMLDIVDIFAYEKAKQMRMEDEREN